jgi:hypothetical protein
MRVEAVRMSITTQSIGAAGELLVAIDLMARGWDVYRNLAGSGCDLMAWKAGAAIRIEVKTNEWSNYGVFKKYPGCILAVVPGSGDIRYYTAEEGRAAPVDL